ncbi:DUF2997 domain-containing protein [bacterium]|nr:DUF2997 domain-containing protein [bacterium]
MSETVQEIEFTIKKDGSVEYTIKGLKGEGCEDLSKIFEQMGDVTFSKKTAEFYEKESDVRITNKQK